MLVTLRMTVRVNALRWSADDAAPTPCKTCPYRTDVPLYTWHREEFEAVLASERAPMGFGAMFGCHATRKAKQGASVCAGWLLDQVKRGVPNLHLRMSAMRDKACVEALNNVHSGGHEMYESAEEMCAANGVE